MEMTFSRGLFPGWMHGVNHQELVSARFGKKRGPFVGRIQKVGSDFVEVHPGVPLAPGDGLVFDTGGDTETEQGGRIYEIRGNRLFFQHRRIDFKKLKPGDRIWKTHDPALEKQLRQSFSGTLSARRRVPLDLVVSGSPGTPLQIEVRLPGQPGVSVAPVCSHLELQEARTAPLTPDRLQEHLGRLHETPYTLRALSVQLSAPVLLPISALNQLRRALVARLDETLRTVRPESGDSWRQVLAAGEPQPSAAPQESVRPILSALCRTEDQLRTALEIGIARIYVDFEDIRRYKDAVAIARAHAGRIFLATPRIQKAGEQGFFKLIENAAPDGVLLRNIGAIDFFRHHTDLQKIGDFSLNTANPLTAQLYRQHGLDLLTVSYDLNLEQVLDLAADCPPENLELTLHQHMPLFHMEHCVFAAFLSNGRSFLDCGRPCEKHRVHLRDRVGMEHPLRADVGCRNTLFNAVPQTGARFYTQLAGAGLRNFRVELLEESAEETRQILSAYTALFSGERQGEDLWRTLRAESQLGVTRGTL